MLRLSYRSYEYCLRMLYMCKSTIHKNEYKGVCNDASWYSLQFSNKFLNEGAESLPMTQPYKRKKKHNE